MTRRQEPQTQKLSVTENAMPQPTPSMRSEATLNDAPTDKEINPRDARESVVCQETLSELVDDVHTIDSEHDETFVSPTNS